MKIAVIGSRSITDKDWVNYHLDENLIIGSIGDWTKDTILSGGAIGVDTLAHEWAKENGVDFVLFKPYHLLDNSVMYNPRYYFVRNKQLVDNADSVIAFLDTSVPSNGTKDVIKYSRKRGKPLLVIEWNEEEAKKINGD